jgi:plasmid stabilization system protein ParE
MATCSGRIGTLRATITTRFVTELERALLHIAEAPERWPVVESGRRRFVLRRFPFSIVYRVQSGQVEVLAVAHGRRRPGYWRDR